MISLPIDEAVQTLHHLTCPFLPTMEFKSHNSKLSSLSMTEVDSNAEILPAKKKNKRKRDSKMSDAEKNPKLSKSQLRKLKKLEDDKEKAVLFSKSMEVLEKYKLSEDAYSLLRSSKSIGKSDTNLEKRRRAAQFLKAGLEGPYVTRESVERRDDGDEDTIMETEPQPGGVETRQDTVDHCNMEQMVADRRQNSSQVLIHEEERNSNGGSSSTLLIEEAPEKVDHIIVKQESITDSTSKIYADDGVAVSSSMKPRSAPCIVYVSRPEDVENQRKDLPIVMMEQEIMEAINKHSCVIIIGETGCGKTTQVPQFLFEAGFGSRQFTDRRGIIGVTQPRRVAVLATAKRVAFELGLSLGKEVGFQVRYDKKIGENSSIKFMTDGILLREVQTDALLRRYSVIILDEAHERTLNTDILIGMLTRIIRLRQSEYERQQKSGKNINSEDLIFPLKVVLMSATMAKEDFTCNEKLFPTGSGLQPPVLEVPGRQFPVTVHFSKKTDTVDYIGQAFKTIMSIHKKLPLGGVLVFVTGQREVEYLCQKLRRASKELASRSGKKDARNVVADVSEISSVGGVDMKEIKEAFDIDGSSHLNEEDPQDIENDLDDYNSESESESEWETFVDGFNSTQQKTFEGNNDLADALGVDGALASLKGAFEALSEKHKSDSNSEGTQNIPVSPEGSLRTCSSTSEKKMKEDKCFTIGPMHVLPLYANLPAAAQLCVFKEVKEGERLVVVATNVAETSLTIPGIKYVVDTGKEKVKAYNPRNDIETFEVQWISKASADQRAGRAGRTGPGHCYRLYSSAALGNEDIFRAFSLAEVLKVPVTSVVLLLKSMGISKVENFPFPTPPRKEALVTAERRLKALGALDSDGKVTVLGKAIRHFPINPSPSKMLLTAIQIMGKAESYSRANLVLGFAIATAAAMSLANPFLMEFEESQTNKIDLENNQASGTSGDNMPIHKQEKLRKKKLKETIKESREKFSNPRSDALTVANALLSFELSKNPVNFCKENALHLKTMEEMSKLKKQLLHLVFNLNMHPEVVGFSWMHGTVDDVEQAWRNSTGKSRLQQEEEEILCQAICAGLADKVAKRFRGASRSFEGVRKSNAVTYKACKIEEDLFLHRRSSLFYSAPEFLVYSDLLLTKKPYMHGATCVKTEWLVKYAKPLCTFSLHTDSKPEPYYNAQEDEVYCWVTPTFGDHLWTLPLQSLPLTSDLYSGNRDRCNERRVVVFTFSLLQGQVLPCLRAVQGFMALPPETILRSEATGQPQVHNLLYALKARSIDSLAKLKKIWSHNPKALHSEIMCWFQKSFRSQFEELWSEMIRESSLEPLKRFPLKKRKDNKGK